MRRQIVKDFVPISVQYIHFKLAHILHMMLHYLASMSSGQMQNHLKDCMHVSKNTILLFVHYTGLFVYHQSTSYTHSFCTVLFNLKKITCSYSDTELERKQ